MRRALADSDHGERLVRTLAAPFSRRQAAGGDRCGVMVTEVDAAVCRRSALRALAPVDPVLAWQGPEQSS